MLEFLNVIEHLLIKVEDSPKKVGEKRERREIKDEMTRVSEGNPYLTLGVPGREEVIKDTQKTHF